MAATLTLSPEDIARRTPLWVALSDLFLDCEPGELEHNYIARTIDEGGFSEEEVLAILRREMGPAFFRNLLSIAGEWAGWPQEVVVEQVLETLAKRPPVLRFGVIESVIDRHWPAIRTKLVERRLPANETPP